MKSNFKKLLIGFILVLTVSLTPNFVQASGFDTLVAACRENSNPDLPFGIDAEDICECVLNGTNCSTVCDQARATNNRDFLNSAQCIAYEIGIPEVQLKDLGTKRNSNNTIRIILQVGFGLLIAVAVFLIVLSGLSVANAKDDMDKRKEGVKKMVNVLIGLVIIFSSYGLALFLFNIFGGEGTDNLIVDCQKLKDKGYDESVIQRCIEQQKGDITPTP